MEGAVPKLDRIAVVALDVVTDCRGGDLALCSTEPTQRLVLKLTGGDGDPAGGAVPLAPWLHVAALVVLSALLLAIASHRWPMGWWA